MCVNSELDNWQMPIVLLVKQFNDLMLESREFPDNEQLFEKANALAQRIIDFTLETYDKICFTFRDVRTYDFKDCDRMIWAILVDYINRYISADKQKVKILDVAAGHGRDMLYAEKLGYNIAGTDNCDGFLEILKNLCLSGQLKTNTIKKCDVRFLDFPDCSFDVVRQNASLVHMPLIKKNYTTDLALGEAFRILRPYGLLHVLVKNGDDNSLILHDTGEGMGKRVFQFFSHKTINEVLTRNGFTIIHMSDIIEQRGNSIINWILVLAQKSH